MSLASVAAFPAYHPASWDTYFTLTGTAAATLTGLFFIAFSLRVRDLQLSTLLRTRARYLLLWLILIAVASALVVMPGQPLSVLGAEVLIVSAGCVGYTLWSVARTDRQELFPLSLVIVRGWIGMAVTWLLSLGAGISLLIRQGGGLYLLAFAVLLGIALEVAAAWSLIVGIGNEAHAQDAHGPEPGPAAAGAGPDLTAPSPARSQGTVDASAAATDDS